MSMDAFEKELADSNGKCVECKERERFKGDLLCDVCRVKSYPQPVKREGLTVTPCRCNCGYTCGRRCGLEIMECIDQHYQRDCDHQWDGEWVEFESPYGGGGGSVTCSKCGTSAMDHDCATGP